MAKRYKRCSRPVCIGLIVASACIVVAVIVIAIVAVSTDTDEDDDPGSPYDNVCPDVIVIVDTAIVIRCDYSQQANIDPELRAKLTDGAVHLVRTTVSRLGFACAFADTDVIECHGPIATCSSEGEVAVNLFDNNGNELLTSNTIITIGDRRIKTSIDQTYSDELTSHFTMSCSITDACRHYRLGFYASADTNSNTRLDGTYDNSTTCYNITNPSTGSYDLRCECVVIDDVISDKGRNNMSCILMQLGNDIVVQQRIFEPPHCSDYRPDCCSKTSMNHTNCQQTCRDLASCLLSDRYQILNPTTACPEVCLPKWCRREEVVDKKQSYHLVDSTNSLLNILCN